MITFIGNKKKKMPFIVAAVFIFILFIPLIIVAQSLSSPPECCRMSANITINGSTCNSGLDVGKAGIICSDSAAPECPRDNWGLYCLMSGINSVTNWIFIFLMAIVSFMIIYGAFNVVTAGGDPNRMSKGRGFILYAMIGFAVALLAKAIPSLVRTILGL